MGPGAAHRLHPPLVGPDLWYVCAGLSGNISEDPRNFVCYLVTVHRKNHIEDIGSAVLVSKRQFPVVR